MPGHPSDSPNAREKQYWNSAAARTWSDGYEPIDRLFAGLTETALGIAAPNLGERVIDIGCGSGTTVLELANRVGSNGYVLGADISQSSVDKARERIAKAGFSQAEVELADVSTHEFAPDSFDLAFSRFGVMFFTDPAGSFANLRRGMKKGGRLALAVFRTAKENKWSTAPVAAVSDLVPPITPPGENQPGMFSWADPARVHRILADAGFRDVSLTPHDPAMLMAGPGGAAEATAFAMSVGPVVRAVSNGTLKEPEAVRARLQSFFQAIDGPQGIVLPGAIWVVTARA